MAKIRSVVVEPKPAMGRINPNKIGKILHLPYNAAGQMSTQANALKLIGANASFCDYYESAYKYPTDIPSPIRNIPKANREKVMLKFAQNCASKYDIFHFHFGQTFTGYSYSDLPLLRSMGKKMVMNYWGTQIRRLSVAKKNNPFAIVKQTNEKLILSRLHTVSKFVDSAIVADHELLEYINGYFRKIYLVKASVNQNLISPAYPNIHNKRPIVVHAPTHRGVKGTEFILQAVENLKKSIKFDFVLIEGMTNEEALNNYKKADIIVDQLRLGSYGTVSIENMLFGKPVITYIRDDLKSKYPTDLPIISANPHTIESVLSKLLINPKLRYETGIKSRKYAEKYHLPERIARQLVSVYNNL
ncbi:glycosyltransferase family 1 protein [Alteribacillus sp. JSM 102045]|uniref:glycosyltransferase family 1 protein n=1 Tax=Alteribacillus sp. JSM 102045 TaxID=1562101 RepID=UPI0035BEE2EC